jgi:multiple sugar transport system substrate-binding protein
MAVRQINPNLKFQVIPIPQLPGTNVTWASYWVEGVSSKSKHQAEAWEFLKYLTSKETMVALYTEVTKDPTRPFGEPYSRIDLAQTIINDPYVGAYVRQAQTAQSFFLASKTYDNGINDLMIKYLEDAVNSLNKGVSVDAALQTAAQGFTQVLTNFSSSAAP